MSYTITWPTGTLTGREFFAGDLALLTNGNASVYEIVKIQTVIDDSIVLMEQPSNIWPEGTRIIPLRKTRIDQLPSRSFPTSNVSTTAIRFEFDDPEKNIVPSWGSAVPIWPFKTNWATAVDGGYARTVYTMDVQSGAVETTDPADVGRVTQRSQVSLFGRNKVIVFRSFVANARGRAVRFWKETGTHDLEPVGTIGGSLTIDVSKIGFVDWFVVPQDARRRLAIVRNDGGETIYRTIVSTQERTEFDRLILDSEIPELARSQIDRVSYVVPARFDQDSFEIEHVTDDLRAVRTSVTVRSTAIEGLGLLPNQLPPARTVAQLNFQEQPAIDFVSTNVNSSASGVFQLATANLLPGSTKHAWMRTSAGNACTVQTESSNISAGPNGFQEDAILEIDGVTFELFVRIDSGAGNWNVFFQGALVDVDGNTFAFYFESNESFGNPEKVEAFYYDTDNTYAPNSSSNATTLFTFPRNRWVHVALVMNGLNFKAYVDGAAIRSSAATSGPVQGLTQHSFQYLWMGTNFGAPSPNVYIDSARVRSGALYSGDSFTPPTSQFNYP